MKILQVGSSLFDWGGIERYVVYLAEGLVERGHEVHVTCPKGSPLNQKAVGTHHNVALKRQFQLSLLPKYLRLLRKENFDVFHVHFSPDFVVPAIAARIAKQQRVLMTRHVVLPWSATKVKRYLGLFEHIVPVSDAVQRILTESGIPAERMTVAKAGVPGLVPTQKREAARSSLGLNDKFAIGFFGRLVPEKGVDTLINSAEFLPEEVSIQIFGSGPQEPELKRLAETHPSKVQFRGFVDNVANAMSAMDAVAIPSVWEEAFPYSALEALSVGVPILGSISGGLPELVDEGITGYLSEKGDAQELAKAAFRLKSKSKDEWNEMSAAARKRHQDEFTIAHFAERMEQVYTSL
ncbi:MAG: glycosyltransferase family 4 protein [Fimbriimonadaceae bacterium]|nr:glycosyltransferase family 4 protein [Fimbriimonadaceae bacterium]